jgi:DNA-binding Lrp family transcriptional regulator
MPVEKRAAGKRLSANAHLAAEAKREKVARRQRRRTGASTDRRRWPLLSSGVIAGYRAHLDRNLLGLAFEALVFVTMATAARETIEAFETAVAAVPTVIDAQRLFGDPDHLLRVIAPDLAAFQRSYDDELATLPGVQRLSATLVMKCVVTDRPLPV